MKRNGRMNLKGLKIAGNAIILIALLNSSKIIKYSYDYWESSCKKEVYDEFKLSQPELTKIEKRIKKGDIQWYQIRDSLKKAEIYAKNLKLK